MRPAAPPTASSSTAPPMRSPRSPATWASPAAAAAAAGARAITAPSAWEPGPTPRSARVASPLFADLLARGRAGGYPADIKMVYSVCGDLVNQLPNIGKTVAALEGLDFMVVHDHFLTPTARFADIVLPATTFWERNDVHTPWSGSGHYVIYMKQAIAPMGECRNDRDICADLARRLGLPTDDDKTEDEWLRELAGPRDRRLGGLPRRGTGASLRSRRAGRLRRGSARPRRASLLDALGQDRDLLRDPGRESGPLRARPDPAHRRPGLPPHPADPRHPLQCVSPKSRARTHSTHDNQEILSRADPQDVWIHPADAAARGIADGQPARVFNDRGATVLPARVTDRIAPRRGVDQGRRLVHARRRGHRHARRRQCPHRGSGGALRGHHLQLVPRRDRGGAVNEEFQRIRGYLRAQGRQARARRHRGQGARRHGGPARGGPRGAGGPLDASGPRPEEWSGNEVLAHVVSAGRYFGGGILAILDGAAVPARPPREDPAGAPVRPPRRVAAAPRRRPRDALRARAHRRPGRPARRRPWSIPCSGRSTGARRSSSCGSTISTTRASWGRSPPRWPERGRHPVRMAIRVSRT